MSKKTKNSILISSISLIASLAIVFNLTSFLNKKKVLGISAQAVEMKLEPSINEEKKYWMDIVENTPSFRDGYLELSDIEYTLGNVQLAQEYLEKAKKIDPNSKIILELEQKYKN